MVRDGTDHEVALETERLTDRHDDDRGHQDEGEGELPEGQVDDAAPLPRHAGRDPPARQESRVRDRRRPPSIDSKAWTCPFTR